MNKKTAFLITLLVSLVIGYSIYAFYQTHERKEITVHTGLLSEARRNPLYAGRLFLKRMGIPASSKNSVKDIAGNFPDTDTVLLIVTKRSSFSENHTEELLDWVRSGGHLIARSVEDWKYAGRKNDEDTKSRDPLQQQLGISTGKSITFDYHSVNEEEEKKDEDDDDQTEENEDDTDSNYEDDFDDDSTIGKILNFFVTNAKDRAAHTIQLKDVNKPLKLQTNGFKALVVADEFKANTEEIKIDYQTFMIRQKVGKGMVTLISDIRFIKNYHLEKSDHAEIFWHLIHGKHPTLDQPKNVWLIHSSEIPNLLDLLLKHAWAFMLSLIFLFLAWLMMTTRRFGPLIPKQAEDRRSLKEHITSSGNFYWKNNHKQKLVNASRDALLQRLAQVHSGWSQRSQEEQVKLLAEQVSMTPKAVKKLLYTQNIEQADEFTSLIRQLERVKKMI